MTVGEKISASPLRNERISKSNKGKTDSEEAKQLIREANKRQFEVFEQRELRRKKSLELWKNPEWRENQIEKHKHKKQSKETIEKRKEKLKEYYYKTKIK